MSNPSSGRLIESINDQYVLLAADPVQAFAAAKANKKSNRTKTFVIAAVAAVLYIAILSAMMIGGLFEPSNTPTPPDTNPPAGSPGGQPGGQPGNAPPSDDPNSPNDPSGGDDPDVTPPDDGSGDEPEMPPTYPEPEITLPDFNFFLQNLNGAWYPSSIDGYRGPTLTYWFSFQADGRVYLMDTATKECQIGRYSFVNDNIEIWTLQEQLGWQKSDIEISLTMADNASGNTLTITCKDKTEKYKRGYIRHFPLSITSSYIEDGNKNLHYLYDIYFEEIELDSLDSVFRFDLPSLEIFDSLTPITYSYKPSFKVSSVGGIGHYKLYNANKELLYEDACDLNYSYDENTRIKIPDTPGVYYLDISYNIEIGMVNSHQIMHYYVAINYRPDTEEYTPPVLTGERIKVMLHDCDTQLNHMELDTKNALQGSGCASVTFQKGDAVVSPNKFSTPIDATGCDVLEFDLYVSDASLLTDDFFLHTIAAIELSSDGRCDYEELTFTWAKIIRIGLAGQELKQGWNHVVFPLYMAQETGATDTKFDISQIDYIRFYILQTGDLLEGKYTVKIDNICLTGPKQ